MGFGVGPLSVPFPVPVPVPIYGLSSIPLRFDRDLNTDAMVADDDGGKETPISSIKQMLEIEISKVGWGREERIHRFSGLEETHKIKNYYSRH